MTSIAAPEKLLRSFLAALPDNFEAVRATASSVSSRDWPSVFDSASRHGVSGILAAQLGRDLVPPAVWKSFVLSRSAQVLAHRQLLAALHDLNEEFAAARIRACMLKGPALAARLFDDPSVRVSTDLDVLISPSDLDRAVAVIEHDGYRGASAATTAYLRQHSHHLDFTKQGAPPIELHFQAYVGFGVTLPAAALMERASEWPQSDGRTVLVPAPEDELIYLAVHAAGHSFVRLSWLYEMKLLILRNPQLDWDQVVARSRKAGLAMAVRYAIELLVRWLSMSLTDVLKRFPSRTLRMTTADRMLDRASRETGRGAANNVKGLVFTSMLCDQVGSTAWLLQHHVLRSARRRAHRLMPATLPGSWAG